MSVAQRKTITINLEHDPDLVPERLSWNASHGGGVEDQEIAAVQIAVWAPDTGLSSRVDFWTKDMTVPEMKAFYAQSFTTMADAFERATADGDLADFIRGFAVEFAQRAGLKRL